MKSKKLVTRMSMVLAVCALLAMSPACFKIVDGSTAEASAAKKVVMSSKKVNLVVGKKKVITLKNATGSIKWTSSNKKVVKITAKKNKCTIKAKKAGKATIKAVLGGKTYKCIVVVKDKPLVLSTTSKTLNVGNTFEINIKNAKNGITVKTSNSCVAVSKVTNKKYKVVAKKAGSSVITFTYNKKKYTCRVVVTASTPSAVTPTEPDTDTIEPDTEAPDNSGEDAGDSGDSNTGDKDNITQDEEYINFYDSGASSILIGGLTTLNTNIGNEIFFSSNIDIDSISVNILDINRKIQKNGENIEWKLSIVDGESHGLVPSLSLISLRPGTFFLNITIGDVDFPESIIEVPENEKVIDSLMFNTWLKTILSEEKGVTGVITESDGYVFEETINYEGVKGADDAETLRNLGAWVVTNKDYSNPGDVLHIYRDGTFGTECSGATTLFIAAARILGYNAYQSEPDPLGHVYAIVEIDGERWSFDAGGSGTAGMRAFTSANEKIDKYCYYTYKRGNWSYMEGPRN